MCTMRNLFLAMASACLLFSSCQTKEKADLIVYNGNVYTIDSAFTKSEAIVVRDGIIVEVGKSQDLLARYQADSLFDAAGQFIYPGFIDAHAHFLGYGYTLQQVDLTGAESWEECVERVGKFLAERNVPAGEWVTGRGWDQNDWKAKKFPDRELLDLKFPDHPIVLSRVDGHAVIASGRALEIAGIRPGQQVEGGEVETDNGRLTGILVDRAEELIGRVLPTTDRKVMIRSALDAQEKLFAMGLTTIVDCGEMATTIEVLDSLQKAGQLKLRLVEMLSDDPANYDVYLKKGPYKTERMNVSAFKIYADGALGSRGACLLEPYSDRPGWRGFLLRDRKHYEEVAGKLYEAGFQACTHAIGDSGNRMVLQVYGKLLKGKNDRRWRIEHAQVVNKEDFPLFGEYSIIPSVQPTHATSDMYWAEERLGGERVQGAYAYQQLLKENGWLPLGTDFPVEDISPLKTFYAAVARKDAKGFPANGFQMENALSRQEALRGMTIWAARGSFEEKEKGSLEKGKMADFIILDKDWIHCDAGEILNTRISRTYLAGERVF